MSIKKRFIVGYMRGLGQRMVKLYLPDQNVYKQKESVNQLGQGIYCLNRRAPKSSSFKLVGFAN